MNDITNIMFEKGIFKQKYKGIIEIYPHKAMNSDLFTEALNEISKTHRIVKMTDIWLRAFDRRFWREIF